MGLSFRRAEFIAFLVVFLLAVIFLGGSYLIVRDIDYDGENVSQVARFELWASGLLNIATELVGAVALYLVFKILFGLGNGQSSHNGERGSTITSEVSAEKSGHHLWKEPLKETIKLLVVDKKLSSDGIGLFRRYKLSDNTELLTAQEVRELRAELAKPEATKDE